LRFGLVAADEIAALRPARPEPIIMISWEIVSVRD